MAYNRSAGKKVLVCAPRAGPRGIIRLLAEQQGREQRTEGGDEGSSTPTGSSDPERRRS